MKRDMTLVDVLRRPAQVCGSVLAVIDGDTSFDYRELGGESGASRPVSRRWA